MTPDRISRLMRNFEEVSTQPRALSSSFYQEFFAIAPRRRLLFSTDVASLQGRFEAALAVTIGNLEDLSALQDSTRELQCRARSRGAKPQDHAVLRSA